MGTLQKGPHSRNEGQCGRASPLRVAKTRHGPAFTALRPLPASRGGSDGQAPAQQSSLWPADWCSEQFPGCCIASAAFSIGCFAAKCRSLAPADAVTFPGDVIEDSAG